MNVLRCLTIAFFAVLSANVTAPTALAQSTVREVVTGGTVELAANAVDPDGDPLTYAWTTTGGQIVGSGPRVLFDSTGLAPGRYTATVTVSDGNCQDSTSVEVNVVSATQPAASQNVGECAFPLNAARVNNECKALLDGIVLQMQQDPRRVLVIAGYSASGERAGVAEARAEAARRYLVGAQGVDTNRVVVRTFDDRCMSGDAVRDRRIGIFLLPAGAAPANPVDCP